MFLPKFTAAAIVVVICIATVCIETDADKCHSGVYVDPGSLPPIEDATTCNFEIRACYAFKPDKEEQVEFGCLEIKKGKSLPDRCSDVGTEECKHERFNLKGAVGYLCCCQEDMCNENYPARFLPTTTTSTTTTTIPTTTTTTTAEPTTTTPSKTEETAESITTTTQTSTVPDTTTTTSPTTITTTPETKLSTADEPTATSGSATTNKTANATASDSEASSKIGLIVGLVVGVGGGVLLLIIAGIVFYWLFIRRRRKVKTEKPLEENAAQDTPTEQTKAPKRKAQTYLHKAPKDGKCDGGSDSARTVIDMEGYSEEELPANIHKEEHEHRISGELTNAELATVLKSFRYKTRTPPVVKRVDMPAKIIQVVTQTAGDDVTEDCAPPSDRTVLPNTEPLLHRLVSHGPCEFSFDVVELIALLKQGEEVLASQPTLAEPALPVVVYGDTHGQYMDLHRWFQLNGWPPKTRSVFLGDFVDRGPHAIELVTLLVALKVAMPYDIYLIRGNHEIDTTNSHFGFKHQVETRFPGKDGERVYNQFNLLFSQLPLAILLGKRILGMHGGISPRLGSLDSIRNIQRPLKDPHDNTLAFDLLWSDPDPKVNGFVFNKKRKCSYYFGKDAVEVCCEKLNIDMIVRAHEPPLPGYLVFCKRKLITIFSAPGYTGPEAGTINIGACLHIDKMLQVTIRRLRATYGYRARRGDVAFVQKKSPLDQKKPPLEPIKEEDEPPSSISTNSLASSPHSGDGNNAHIEQTKIGSEKDSVTGKNLYFTDENQEQVGNKKEMNAATGNLYFPDGDQQEQGDDE